MKLTHADITLLKSWLSPDDYIMGAEPKAIVLPRSKNTRKILPHWTSIFAVSLVILAIFIISLIAAAEIFSTLVNNTTLSRAGYLSKNSNGNQKKNQTGIKTIIIHIAFLQKYINMIYVVTPHHVFVMIFIVYQKYFHKYPLR
jgi:hypothetical protein